jgi:hypothetical protein
MPAVVCPKCLTETHLPASWPVPRYTCAACFTAMAVPVHHPAATPPPAWPLVLPEPFAEECEADGDDWSNPGLAEELDR